MLFGDEGIRFSLSASASRRAGAGCGFKVRNRVAHMELSEQAADASGRSDCASGSEVAQMVPQWQAAGWAMAG